MLFWIRVGGGIRSRDYRREAHQWVEDVLTCLQVKILAYLNDSAKSEKWTLNSNSGPFSEWLVNQGAMWQSLVIKETRGQNLMRLSLTVCVLLKMRLVVSLRGNKRKNMLVFQWEYRIKGVVYMYKKGSS
jgi:hypothetical protein